MDAEETIRAARAAVADAPELIGKRVHLGRGELLRVRLVELVSTFEERWLTRAGSPGHAPASSFDPRGTESDVDVWSQPIDPASAPDGYATLVLDDHEATIDCPACEAGELRCDDCGGSGRKPGAYELTSYWSVCGTCGGRPVRCTVCGGSAVLVMRPVVHARVRTERRTELLHDGSIPEEIAREIASVTLAGARVVYALEDEAVQRVLASGSDPYRGSTLELPHEVASVVRRLVARPPASARWRDHSVRVVDGHVVRFPHRRAATYVHGEAGRVAIDGPLSRWPW